MPCPLADTVTISLGAAKPRQRGTGAGRLLVFSVTDYI